MATVVDNPSIASARERAEAILYGNERFYPPVGPEEVSSSLPQETAAPVVAEYSVPVAEPTPTPTPAPAKPTRYYHTEIARYPRPAATRDYVVDGPFAYTEPQVVHPVVDVETDLSVPTTATTAPVAVTTKSVKVESEIDQELEENTQYVVRFKTPTLVAAAALTVILGLMLVLMVVNIVNLTTMSATLSSLTQQEQVLSKTLRDTIAESETLWNQTLEGIDWADYQRVPVTTIKPDEVELYEPAAPADSGGGFFSWLCRTLSGIFG